ncbi:hypothetical protein BKA82DRAFT_1004616 [Pisolithus tinctorius]|uniref:Uncharacterized protein n=1 Tax=Pisolithus tinctorius Marx 270 TaxID=870435 RepID=A0A0C3JPT4_PISTI|nr:hypothetical protein BKA82DRAFT_1004616 [Pisolithus tinctorius]KIN99511.1 hypothetical protein M404DRAFT_1004616 [Pisolithus tinctorius Marx 270]
MPQLVTQKLVLDSDLDKFELEALKAEEECRLAEARFQPWRASFQETRESTMTASCETAAEAKRVNVDFIQSLPYFTHLRCLL